MMDVKLLSACPIPIHSKIKPRWTLVSNQLSELSCNPQLDEIISAPCWNPFLGS
jgi:hypothetical protein